MDSPEGKGRARKAWDAYANAVNKAAAPALEQVIDPYARKQVNELIGFYVLWHLYGGFEGLVERGGMHPSTVWPKVKKFRLAFKEHPDTYLMPGVKLDPADYWADAAKRGAEQAAALNQDKE